jgi:hypothetical protein
MSLHSFETCDLLMPLSPIVDLPRRNSAYSGYLDHCDLHLPRKPSVLPGAVGSNCLAAASVSEAEAIPAGCRAHDPGNYCARSALVTPSINQNLEVCFHQQLQHRFGQRAQETPLPAFSRNSDSGISRRPSVPLPALVAVSQLDWADGRPRLRRTSLRISTTSEDVASSARAPDSYPP